MKLIKLSAIPSTNDYLKHLLKDTAVENFTTIYTNYQTQGKGQRGNVWIVEAGKNLTFSTLYQIKDTTTPSIFDLNIIVALSIIKALEQLEIPNLKIKWPNDIMSQNKKIGGILIENSFTSCGAINSVIGIGLNVNQQNFEQLPTASSLYKICQKEFDLEGILQLILKHLQNNLLNIQPIDIDKFWTTYHHYLFKKNIPTVFKTPDGKMQMGIIQQVLRNGKIEILFEDDNLYLFDLKEITLVY